MAFNRPHVHTAWKTEHPEAGTEHVISILKDRKSQVELSRKGGRSGSRVGAHAHHLTAGSLDGIQLSLQLHDLLLTRASTASFIALAAQLAPPPIGKRTHAPIALRDR